MQLTIHLKELHEVEDDLGDGIIDLRDIRSRREELGSFILLLRHLLDRVEKGTTPAQVSVEEDRAGAETPSWGAVDRPAVDPLFGGNRFRTGNAEYDCDCDCVMEMERMGVGVEEIVQYAQSVLTRTDILALLAFLQGMIPATIRPRGRDRPPPAAAGDSAS